MLFDNKRKEEDKKCFVKHSIWCPTKMVLNETNKYITTQF